MRVPWAKGKGSKSPKNHRSVGDFLFTRAKMHWWLLGVVFILAVIFIAFPMEKHRRFLDSDDFRLGEKSPRDVLSPFSFNYYDETATEEEKAKASAELPPVFELDFQSLESAEEEFNTVRQVRSSYMLTDAEKVDKMRRFFFIGPSDQVGLILTTASDEQIDEMENSVINVLSDIMAKGVMAGGDGNGLAEELAKIDYIKPKWEQISNSLNERNGRKPTDDQIAAKLHVALIDNRSESTVEKVVSVEDLLLFWSEATDAVREAALRMPEPIGSVVSELCVDLMRPNLIYNSDLTQKRRERLLSDFPPVSQRIPEGNKIVGAGEVVTESTRGKLEAISSLQKRSITRSVPGAALLVGLLAYVLVVYLRKYEPLISSEPRKIIALNIAILLILVLGILIIIGGSELNLYRPGFLIPAALASIVVAILANVQLAIVITCIIGVLVAMLAGINISSSLAYFLVILAGGITAAISASRARRRRHLMAAGIYVSGVNVITILGLGLLENVSLVKLGTSCVMGAINGAAIAILTPGLLPIFEYLSRTTTDMELLELADLNQPLLTQLKEHAAGSYYHSSDVAKLAEAAAEAIGANPLLARVGSYYHDIGKVAKPEYFIENQNGENIHDTLNPSMSARVIKAHVGEYGVNLAKEEKLPQVVVDIIQQHHGTTLIGGRHFYQKAMEADRHNTVKLEDFRYPGPKPQTQEAAIVLLADSVESARHVMLRDSPTYSRLISFVKEIVEGKMVDSQLDECDLTLKDINLITNAFARVLSGMYHTRVEYPKAVEAAPKVAEGGAVDEKDRGKNR